MHTASVRAEMHVDAPVARSSSSGVKRLTDAFFFSLMLVGVGLVAWVNVRFLRNHFAAEPFFHDTGWLSGAFYNGSLGLRNPSSMQTFSESLYATHMFVAFALGSALWRHLPFEHHQVHAWLNASMYALSFAAPFWALSGRGRASVLRVCLSFLASLAFTFSGLSLSCVSFPHPEPFVPFLSMMAIAAYLAGRRRSALAVLVLMCLCREDAGLHFVGLLAVFFLYQRVTRRSLVSESVLGVAAIICITLAAALLFAQKAFFTPDNFRSLLTTNYLHDQVMAQVGSWSFWKSRFAGFYDEAGFIAVPLVLVTVLAVVRRELGYLVGLVSTLPWLLVNLQSTNPASQHLTLYYGFPFFVAFAWPAFMERLLEERHVRPPSRVIPATLLLLVSLSSTWAFWERYEGPARGIYEAIRSPAKLNVTAVHQLRKWLRGRTWDRRLAVEPCVAAILPDDVPPGSVAFAPLADYVEQVAYTSSCYDSPTFLPQLTRFTFHYALGGAKYRIASTVPLRDLPRSARRVPRIF